MCRLTRVIGPGERGLLTPSALMLKAMKEPILYQIVIRGRAGKRLLWPLLDDFTVDHPDPQSTRLVGEITDPAHLHGVLHHLTSVAAEVVSMTPIESDIEQASNPTRAAEKSSDETAERGEPS